MNLLSILYFVLIRPLELIYELIFSLSYKFTGSAVLSIVFLSITVGLLCLPLYTRADALQAEANVIENKLKPWKTKIKKVFKGDEQVMMLQAYYRENNYHPLMMMRSSISLLLQIPFFISAYHMLSSSVALQGTSFGPIADLGAPDGIIKIGAFAINLLPILMTAINIISGTIYSKDLDIKAKIQLYVTALVFLVLLYNSPSGLVLYWTLNNVFSLVKNIVMKLVPASKKPRREKTYKKDKLDTVIFVLYALGISTLIGLLIPSDYLVRSVENYMWNYRFENMSYYLWISFFIGLGFFLVWGGIYYYVAKNKRLAAGVMITFTAWSLINYFAFYSNEALLNTYLNDLYDHSFFGAPLNLIVLVLVTLLIYIVFKNTRKVFLFLYIPIALAIVVVSASNITSIVKANNSYAFVENQREYPEITLSSDKPNVIVIMLDRAGGRVLPYIMNERPDLIEEFDGFTWYRNSLSFGQSTNMGIPALYGGYEYTPAGMNSRPELLLEDKHNEALSIMPIIFDQNGFNVTMLDPAYAGYKLVPDLSIYEDYPDIDAYVSYEILNPYFDELADNRVDYFERNFFVLGFRLASPIAIREMLYDYGYYNDLNSRLLNDTFFQSISDNSHATGYNLTYMNSYYTLLSLPSITNFSDGSETGSFVFIDNTTSHEPTLLEEPDYSISNVIDNSAYDQEHADRLTLDGVSMELYFPEEMGYYEVQIAAYETLARWFDYLREQGVYDNTRIIIVSDHGARYWLFGNTCDNAGNPLGINGFNCLVMVKDFGATGFNVSDDFITNAETPCLAFNGLIEDPVNPFTGNPIVSRLDHPEDFLYFVSGNHNVYDNNGYTYTPGDWYSYDPSSGDIFDESAWEYEGNY